MPRKKEPTPADGAEKRKEEPTIADLMKRLDDLEKDNTALTETNAALMAAPPRSPDPPVKPVEPKFDISTEGLPDPVTEPEKYAKALNERIAAAVKDGVKGMAAQERAASASTTDRDAKVGKMWDAFAGEYPDIAKHQEIVEIAATKVARRAQELGVDLDRYMFTGRKQFFKDVANEVKTTYGKFLEDDPEKGDGDGDEEGPDRTEGIFGGLVPAGKGRKGPSEEESGDMVKDIHELQKKSGFF